MLESCHNRTHSLTKGSVALSKPQQNETSRGCDEGEAIEM